MATSQERVEELLRLLEEQNSVEQPRSAQQQNIDRFQRTFEESPFGGAARRERIEEISRFYDERKPIPNYGRSGFLEAVRGDPPPPPPEEGSTSLVPYIPPETGTGIDIGIGYRPAPFRPEARIPEEEEKQGLRSIPRGLWRGFAQSGITMTQGLISIADMITNVAGFEDAIDPESMEFLQTLREISARVGHEEHMLGKLSEALGSMLTIAAPGFAQAGFAAKAATSIAAGNAAKSTLGMAKLFQATKYTAAGGLGSGEANQLLEAHKEAGGDYTIGQRNLAIAIGVPIGLLELANIELFLKGFPRGWLPDKVSKNRLMSRVIELATTATTEGLQEGFSSILQEASAKYAHLPGSKPYNPEQPIGDSFLSDFGYGAGAGAIFDLLLRGFVGKRGRTRSARAAEKEHAETAPLEITNEELVEQRKREEPATIYDRHGEAVDVDFMDSKDGVATFILQDGTPVEVPMSGAVSNEGWSLWPDEELANSRYPVETGQDENGNPIYSDIGDLTDGELDEFRKGINESVNESGVAPTPQQDYEGLALHKEIERRGLIQESDDLQADLDPLQDEDDLIDTADASVQNSREGDKVSVFNFDGSKEEVIVSSLNPDGSIEEVLDSNGEAVPFNSRFTDKNIKNPSYRMQHPDQEFTGKKVSDFTNKDIQAAKKWLDSLRNNPDYIAEYGLEQDINAVNYEINRRNSGSAVEQIDREAGRNTGASVINRAEEDIISDNLAISDLNEQIAKPELPPEQKAEAERQLIAYEGHKLATESVLNDLSQTPGRSDEITQEEFNDLVSAKFNETGARPGLGSDPEVIEGNIDSRIQKPVTEGGFDQENTETSFTIPYSPRGTLSAPDLDSDIAYRAATAKSANKPSQQDQESVAKKLGLSVKDFAAQAKLYSNYVKDLARKNIGSQEGVKSSWPSFPMEPFSEFVGKESEGTNRSSVEEKRNNLGINLSTFKRLIKDASGSTRQPKNKKEIDTLFGGMNRDQRMSLINMMEDFSAKKEKSAKPTNEISLDIDQNGNFLFTIFDQSGNETARQTSREAGAEEILSVLSDRYNFSETNTNEILDQIAKKSDLSRTELPIELAGAKVNYGYGQKGNYELIFNSDIDKALYIVANQRSKSARDADYINFLKRSYELAGTPKTTAQLRSLGSKLKNDVIKPLAKQATPDESAINVPVFSASVKKPPLRRMIPGTGERLFGSTSDLDQQAAKKILEIIKRVAPNSDTVIADQIYDDQGNLILGAQINNVISVSTSGDYHADIENRSFHEATHYLLSNKYFTPKQEAFIRSEKNLNNLRKIVRNILGDAIYERAIPSPEQGPEGIEGEVQELLSYASGYYNSSMERTGNPPAEFEKGPLLKILDAIRNLFKQIGYFFQPDSAFGPGGYSIEQILDEIRLGYISHQGPLHNVVDNSGYKPGSTPSYMIRNGSALSVRSENAYVNSILDEYFKGVSAPKKAAASEWIRPLDEGGFAGILRPNGNAKVKIKGKQFSVKLAELRASGLIDYLTSKAKDQVVTRNEIRGFLDTKRRLLSVESTYPLSALDSDIEANERALVEDNISFNYEILGARLIRDYPPIAGYLLALPRIEAIRSAKENKDLESEASKSWPEDIVRLHEKYGDDFKNYVLPPDHPDSFQGAQGEDRMLKLRRRTRGPEVQNRSYLLELIGNPDNFVTPEKLGRLFSQEIGRRRVFVDYMMHGDVTTQRLVEDDATWRNQQLVINEVHSELVSAPLSRNRFTHTISKSDRFYEGLAGNKRLVDMYSLLQEIGDLQDSLKPLIARSVEIDPDTGARVDPSELEKKLEVPFIPRYEEYTTGGQRGDSGLKNLPFLQTNHREIVLTMPPLLNEAIYRSSHYDSSSNPVVHFRLADFDSSLFSGGERILVIEEIQSDYHQEMFNSALEWLSDDTWGQPFYDLTREQKNRVRELMTDEYLEKFYRSQRVNPDLPFKSRNEWTNLAISHIARIAANEGYDGIAIAGSELQVQRYQKTTSNRIQGITVTPSLYLEGEAGVFSSVGESEQIEIHFDFWARARNLAAEFEAGRIGPASPLPAYPLFVNEKDLVEKFGRKDADILISESKKIEEIGSDPDYMNPEQEATIRTVLEANTIDGQTVGITHYMSVTGEEFTDPTYLQTLPPESSRDFYRKTGFRKGSAGPALLASRWAMSPSIKNHLLDIHPELSNAYEVTWTEPTLEGVVPTNDMIFGKQNELNTGSPERAKTFKNWIGSGIFPLIEDQLDQLNLQGREVFSAPDLQSFISEKVKELKALSDQVNAGENVTPENISRLKKSYTDATRKAINQDGSVGIPVSEQPFRSYYDHLVPNNLLKTLTLGLSKKETKKYKDDKKFIWLGPVTGSRGLVSGLTRGALITYSPAAIDFAAMGASKEEAIAGMKSAYPDADPEVLQQVLNRYYRDPLKIVSQEELAAIPPTGFRTAGGDQTLIGGMQNSMRYFPITNEMLDTGMKGNYSLNDPQPLWKMAADIESGQEERRTLSKNQNMSRGEWAASVIFNPLKGLPDQSAYKLKRAKVLGLVHKTKVVSQRISKDIAPYLDKRNPKKRKDYEQLRIALYKYMTTAPAQGEADLYKKLKVIDPKVAVAAERAKNIIESIGKELVQRGIIPPDTFYANRRSYLPRIYLKHVMSEPAGQERGYAKRRKPALDKNEIAREELGEIAELAPEFLVSRTIQRPMRDLAMIEFFDSIAGHSPWVANEKEILVEWKDGNTGKTKEVSAFWLVHQADQIRKIAEFRKHGDEDKYKELNKRADDMIEAASPKIAQYAEDNGFGSVRAADGTIDPAKVAKIKLDATSVVEGYKRVPNNPEKYGMLAGLSVANPIYDDVLTSMSYVGWGDNAYVRLEERGRKFTAMWKTLKVPLNPPTVIRNVLSNMILMHLSGVPMRRVVPNFAKAIKEAHAHKNGNTEGSKHYQAMLDRGVSDASFTASELYTLSSETQDLLKGVSIEDGGFFNWLNARTWQRLASVGGKLYQNVEVIGKTAVAIEMMEHQGKNADEAFLIANDALFDYSLVPPLVRGLRTAPFLGVPFITFYYKVFPLLAKTALDNPFRFAPYVALMVALPEIFKNLYDIDDDEYETVQQMLPDFARDPTATFPVPRRNADGKLQMLDLGYILPWGAFTSLALQGIRGAKQIAGVPQVSGLDYQDIVRTIGLFSSPGIPLAGAAFNRDFFTGREISDPNQPWFIHSEESPFYAKGKILDSLLWAANQYMLPGFLHTEYGAATRLYDSINNREKRTGMEGASIDQAILKMFGLNLYTIDPRQLASSLDYYEREEQKLIANLNRLKKDQSLSREERLLRRESYNSQIRKNRERLAFILSKTQMTPNLNRVLKGYEERKRDLDK